MHFSITLSDSRLEAHGDSMAPGALKLGDFQEDFLASLSYWNPAAYRSQWQEASERLVEGKDRPALITSMHDPRTANFIVWWPLYRDGDSVHVHNQILFLDELVQPFDESDLYRAVPPRETKTDEGDPISEWTVRLSNIEEFLRVAR
jgi:hypothetical protein